VRPVVFIMSRLRASDHPSSFVLQGFLDFITSSHEIAAELRQHIIFKIIPVVNPDGVFIGNTRGNLLGQDLNRHWHDTNEWSQPTIYAIRKVLEAIDADKENFALETVLDMHSTSSLLGLFIVGNSYDSVYRFERHIVLPKIIAQNCLDFSHENTIYNCDQGRDSPIFKNYS
jgi:hypothetical protein